MSYPQNIRGMDDLQLAVFVSAYRQAGMSPKQLVEFASRLRGGREAIVEKALRMTAA